MILRVLRWWRKQRGMAPVKKRIRMVTIRARMQRAGSDEWIDLGVIAKGRK